MRCLNLIGHFCVMKRNFISLFLDKILKNKHPLVLFILNCAISINKVVLLLIL